MSVIKLNNDDIAGIRKQIINADKKYNNQLLTPILTEIDIIKLNKLREYSSGMSKRLKDRNKQLDNIANSSELSKYSELLVKYINSKIRLLTVKQSKSPKGEGHKSISRYNSLMKDGRDLSISGRTIKVIIDKTVDINKIDYNKAVADVVNYVSKLQSKVEIYKNNLYINAYRNNTRVHISAKNNQYNYASLNIVTYSNDIITYGGNENVVEVVKLLAFALHELFSRQREIVNNTLTIEDKTHRLQDVVSTDTDLPIYVADTKRNTYTVSQGGTHSSPRSHYRRGCEVHRNGKTFYRKGSIVNKHKEGTKYIIK